MHKAHFFDFINCRIAINFQSCRPANFLRMGSERFEVSDEIENMCQLLVENHFDTSVVEIFRANKIDRNVFIDLDKDDMKELGIMALGDRKRLQQIGAKLRGTTVSSIGPLTSIPSHYNWNGEDSSSDVLPEMQIQCST